MFSLINLILTIIILFRVFKYDKFYVIHLDNNVKYKIEKNIKQ